MNLLLFVTLAAALSFEPAAQPAPDDVAKAAKAYRQAQQAELSEEYALASDLYELADQLAPTAEALRGAVRMALAAERWAVAADKALELRRRYPDDAKSIALADQTLARTRPLLSEVTVECGGVDCTVLVDGKSAVLEPREKHVVFVDAGAHRISGGYPAGSSEAVAITAEAGGSSDVQLTPPAAKSEGAPPPTVTPADRGQGSGDEPRDSKRRSSRRKISPWFFGVGAVATVGLAAGAAVSGVQARNAGDDFDDGGRTRELYDKANALEIQTNVLFGVSVAVGVTTIVLAAVTDWRRGRDRDDRRRARLSPALAPRGGGLVLQF